MRLVHLVVIAIIVATVPVATARTITVSPTGADAAGCGLGAAACGTLGFALRNVSQPGDVIELRPGLYVETGPTIEFGAASGLANLTIRSSTGDPDDVTIDRQYRGRLLDFADGAGRVEINGIRFFRGGWTSVAAGSDYAGATLRLAATGATIRFEACVFERCLNPNFGYAGRGGVGVITAGAPEFVHCRFTDNWGGIAGTFLVGSSSTPIFEHCVFEHSGCHMDGWGGVLVPEGESRGVWRHCVFRNNTCAYGGAVDDGGTASPLFENCTFESNRGLNLGGAYYGFGGTTARFVGCRFIGNRVNKGGNGQDYYLSNSVSATFEDSTFDAGDDVPLVADGASGSCKDSSSITMRGCIVRGYRANYGAVLVTLNARGTFESSVFVNNECGRGGALALERPTTISNCTFENNVANEGGAVFIWTAVDGGAIVHIRNSIFRNNKARNAGGAIRVIGPTKVTLIDSLVDSNWAERTGGGGLMTHTTSEVTVNGTTFHKNRAPSGGAIWADGTLVAVDSHFESNSLVSDNVEDSSSCGNSAGSGGGIYVWRERSDLFDAALDHEHCVVDHLTLIRNVFIDNNATAGGGGALFLDGELPRCTPWPEDVCEDCAFLNNYASFGADLGSTVSQLEVRNYVRSSWTLMAPVDITIGARDLFGHAISGTHAPIVVRASVVNADNESLPLPVVLVSNASRMMRTGEVTFKSLALKMAEGMTNTVDRELVLRFTCDTYLSDGTALAYYVNITLVRCPQSSGLLTAEGRCVIEATNNNSQEVIAGVIVAVVVGAVSVFVFVWSYRHSHRLLETIHSIVTGVGGVLVRFMFELLDIATDIQALVNLFLYDLTFSRPTLIRSLYLTIFIISVVPSVGLLLWSVRNVKAQWKRLQARKVVAAEQPGDTTNSRRAFRAPSLPLLLATRPGWSRHGFHADQILPGASGASQGFQAAIFDHRNSGSTAQISAAQVIRLNGSEATAYVTRQIKLLQVELEYQHVRTQYMKQVMARVFAEDILLLVFNLYIYFSNQDDANFARSHFRLTLEYSIFMSGIQLGSQTQSIVTWLQVNKIGEIVDQLNRLGRLIANQPKLPEDQEHGQSGN